MGINYIGVITNLHRENHFNMPIKQWFYTLLPFLLINLCVSTSYGQNSLFIQEVAKSDLPTNISSTIPDRIIRIDQSLLTRRISKIGSSEKLEIGLGLTESPRNFDFKQNKILSDDFVLRLTSDGSFRKVDGRHYSGRNEDGSLIAISFFENDKVHGVIIDKGITYDIEPVEIQGKAIPSLFRLVFVKDLPEELRNFCHTDYTAPTISEEQYRPSEDDRSNTKAAGPIDIHLECDFKMFTDLGGEPATTNYVTGLMNVVFTLFSDEGVTLQCSELVVWQTQDPYGAAVPGTNTSIILNDFKCLLPSYNGRIAHLLSTASGLGGRADRPSHTSCPFQGLNYGFSAIFTTYNPDLSVYSWSINVIAHEIGHQMSAHHTHDCVWNGDDTQIDDCGNVLSVNQGQTPNACYDSNNPIIPTNAQGTIMSYCHTSAGTGVNLALGFNAQIGARMNEFAMNCIGNIAATCAPPNETNISVEILSSTSVRISNSLPSANFWVVAYIGQNGSAPFVCHNGCSSVSTASDITLTGLDPAVTYEIQAAQFCVDVSAWSAWSCFYEYGELMSGVDCTTSTATINSANANSTVISSSNTLSTSGSITVSTSTPLTWQSLMSLELNNNVTLNQGVIMDMNVGPCN